MEHVGARRIDVYCDEERLPIRDAVQFAHRNPVMRDLNPGTSWFSNDGGGRKTTPWV